MALENSAKIGLMSAAAVGAAVGQVQAQDWTGAYVGLGFGQSEGTSPAQPYVYDEGYQLDGSAASAFAGLRWSVNDRFVMGVELAINGNINVDEPASQSTSEPYSFDNLADLKLSVGMPVGKALVYGFAGVSAGTLHAYGNDEYNATGANFGLGVDYAINDKFSVGLEYIARNMTGYTSGGNPEDQTMARTLSLRAAFHF